MKTVEHKIYLLRIQGVDGGYVGATCNLLKRVDNHDDALKDGRHVCPRFQAAWLSAGMMPKLRVTVLETVDAASPSEVADAEYRQMQLLKEEHGDNWLFNSVRWSTGEFRGTFERRGISVEEQKEAMKQRQRAELIAESSGCRFKGMQLNPETLQCMLDYSLKVPATEPLNYGSIRNVLLDLIGVISTMDDSATKGLLDNIVHSLRFALREDDLSATGPKDDFLESVINAPEVCSAVAT